MRSLLYLVSRAVLSGCFFLTTIGTISAEETGKEMDIPKQIAAWGREPMTGPLGRPLPLAGNWMCEDTKGKTEAEQNWGPAYMADRITRGHYVLPTFIDSFSVGHRLYVSEAKNGEEKINEYKRRWQPVLEYCRDNQLPFAIRGWNWDTYPITYQEALLRKGTVIPPEQDVRLFENGAPNSKYTDPMGPLEPWRQVGAFWLGNPLVQWMREIYPNPPMVILLNNNEAGKLHSAAELAEKSDRYREEYGKDSSHAARILKEGYQERRKAMYDAARGAAGSWSGVLRFVAYNNLWNTMEVGRKRIDWPRDGYPLPEPWDGGMLELYDNDWQPGKTDFRTWSMQGEAMNSAGVLPDILRQRPDFFWSTITWDGENPGDVYRPRGNPVASTSKAFYYITRGQRWDQHRFEGWVQFGLWVQRPRLCFEFRGNPSRSAYDELTWQVMMSAVDRPWNNPVLTEFWRFGQLVANREEAPFWPLSGDEPEWLQKLDRWFLLTSSANPARPSIAVLKDSAEAGQRLPDAIVEEDREWSQYTTIMVWAVALKLGEKPDRRWLIYAHAPQGDVTDSTVRLPDFGEVKLPLIPVGGSFFHVTEATRAAQPVSEGRPGMCGSFWTRPEGIPEELVYRLPLDLAYDWHGPWAATGETKERLLFYRHLPNLGSAPPAILVGGQFVEDPERGKVLQLDGQQDAVWFIANKQTVLAAPGLANRTLSLWIKPQDVHSRQVVYAEGNFGVGLNIHLDGGRVHAGAWAPAGPKPWDGAWLTSDEIEPNRWSHLMLVFTEAEKTLQPEKMKLFVNGKLSGSAPGLQMPKSYTPPRIGTSAFNRAGVPLTRFVRPLAAKEIVPSFKGRLDEILIENTAEEAEKP